MVVSADQHLATPFLCLPLVPCGELFRGECRNRYGRQEEEYDFPPRDGGKFFPYIPPEAFISASKANDYPVTDREDDYGDKTDAEKGSHRVDDEQKATRCWEPKRFSAIGSKRAAFIAEKQTFGFRGHLSVISFDRKASLSRT